VPFLLIDPRNHYAVQSGLIGKDGTDTAKGRPEFQTAKSSYQMSDGQKQLVVDLTDTTQSGVKITKRFIFDRGRYLISIDYLIDNESEAPFTAAMFGQIKRDSQTPVVSDVKGMRLRPYTGGATFKDDSPYTKLKFGDIEDDPYHDTVKGGYMAMVQHYFVTAWVPEKGETHTFTARKLGNQDIYLYGYTTPNWTVEPGKTYTEKSSFYVGPKNQYKLKAISPGLNLTVDYGFLWWLAEPLFELLTFIHSVVGNWGVSIILLTMCVKALLYPLSATSLRSMAKMRRLQPEMARLKERYGDDRQQFSQAMMDLYKKEGTNPLGGCLPMLLQMPVFLALYWTLMESVELRHSPFIFWIHDLSDMDPYFVLPILMGGSMFLNQMMQPEPPDPIQAKVFKFMPVMFTFFFLWFPSGLVLYWLVNNLLSVLQQWYVTRQLEKSS
ncbi:MAG TPA: membrane protein insertase YidC, partial [Pseudomonadales bacterium]|nr:membrane protein insertase YidC [Pseudomonadales bacterium]